MIKKYKHFVFLLQMFVFFNGGHYLWGFEFVCIDCNLFSTFIINSNALNLFAYILSDTGSALRKRANFLVFSRFAAGGGKLDTLLSANCSCSISLFQHIGKNAQVRERKSFFLSRTCVIS